MCSAPLKEPALVSTAAPVAMNPGKALSSFSSGARRLPTAHSRSICVMPAMPPKLNLNVALRTWSGSGRPCASCSKKTPPCRQQIPVQKRKTQPRRGLKQSLASALKQVLLRYNTQVQSMRARSGSCVLVRRVCVGYCSKLARSEQGLRYLQTNAQAWSHK